MARTEGAVQLSDEWNLGDASAAFRWGKHASVKAAAHSSVSSRSYCHPRSCDLFIGIAVYAENIIVLRFCGFARGTEIGIYVFPNDLTLRCNLEKASEPPFVDQCISVRQALGIRDARTKKIRKNTFLVFPHNVICSRIYPYDSGKRKALVQPVSAVRKLAFDDVEVGVSDS